MLLPEVDFSFGKPSPKSPPIPGNLGALEAALPLFEATEELEPPPPVRLLFALTELLLLFADFPPKLGADLSFVTVFFKAFPCCIDLSNAPRSVEPPPPPPDDLGLKAGAAGGLGGPGAGGGPGGGGGGGICLLVSYTSQIGMSFN